MYIGLVLVLNFPVQVQGCNVQIRNYGIYVRDLSRSKASMTGSRLRGVFRLKMTLAMTSLVEEKPKPVQLQLDQKQKEQPRHLSG